jgi:DNA mismatch repair protein MutS2
VISIKTLKSIEYDKIMARVATFAVLEETKEKLTSFVPLTTFDSAFSLLKRTEEAYKYLFTYSVGGIYFFDNVFDELKRVDIGGVLNNSELLKIACNLKSARIARNSILSVNDDNVISCV